MLQGQRKFYVNGDENTPAQYLLGGVMMPLGTEDKEAWHAVQAVRQYQVEQERRKHAEVVRRFHEEQATLAHQAAYLAEKEKKRAAAMSAANGAAAKKKADNGAVEDSQGEASQAKESQAEKDAALAAAAEAHRIFHNIGRALLAQSGEAEDTGEDHARKENGGGK